MDSRCDHQQAGPFVVTDATGALEWHTGWEPLVPGKLRATTIHTLDTVLMTMQRVEDPELARRLRRAAHAWQEASDQGTAQERNRPVEVLPPSHLLLPVSDLIMGIACAMEALDDMGFVIAQVFSDMHEDRIVWIGPGERFVHVGCSAGATVIVGHLVNGNVPVYDPSTHLHARDLVPAAIAATLPTIELAPGETDMRTVLDACALWAQAALDALPAQS